MGTNPPGIRSAAVTAKLILALVACACVLLMAAAARAATPTDLKLAIPLPADTSLSFRWFDESGGRVVFPLPEGSSSPMHIYSWTADEGLTSLATGAVDDPAVDGDVVVWVDGDSVKGVDLSTDKHFDLGDGVAQYQPEVSGDWVVWDEGLHQIRAYNVTTDVTRTLSSSTTGLRQSPRIAGDLVVWMDDRDELGYDIYGCRLSTGTDFPICTDYGWQMNPDTDGTYVVWVRDSPPSRIFARNLDTGDPQFQVEPDVGSAAQDGAHISDGLVTWASDAWGSHPFGLYARRLPSGVTFYVAQGAENVVPDGDKIYHRLGTELWCATLAPVAGSLAVHTWTATPGYVSAATVQLDVAADSDAGAITSMDFGTGWEPFSTTKTIGPLADGWHTITARVRDDADNQAQITSAPFYVDTTLPLSTWSLTPPHSNVTLTPGWFNSDVVLHLGIDDASGVGTVFSQVGGGPWLPGGPLRFDARADHSLDGWYTVHLYGVDAAGNIEAAPQTVEFGIDTTPPTAAAQPVLTAPGTLTALRFVVTDRAPSTRSARAAVTVIDRHGRRILRLPAKPVRLGSTVTRTFVCHLRPGRYRYLVRAVDGAGNGSMKRAAARLVVK